MKNLRTWISNVFQSEEKIICFFIVISFLMWMFVFKGFLFGKIPVASDAISYYEHTKYFVESLARNVIPLWDPNWNCGVNNEFFLRRFNEFNPAYFFLILSAKMGLPYRIGYILFCVFYNFLGAYGFYLLARRIFHYRKSAFTAFCLFLFSSLTTRMFDSYLHLMFVPMIWFFYFFLDIFQALSEERQSPGLNEDCDRIIRDILGILLTSMILMGTYIPFYFISIAISFFLLMIIFSPKKMLRFVFVFGCFLKKHKILIVIVLVCFGLSLLPGWLFYKQSSLSHFVLPGRPSAQNAKHIFEVNKVAIKDWGIMEDIVYVQYFNNLKRFTYAVLYLPLFAFIIFAMGLFNKISKRLLFFCFWGMGLFLVYFPRIPLYDWFYSRVFFFKYFKNLHFFLWIILSPVAILFLTEIFDQYQHAIKKKKINTVVYVLFAVLVHGLVLFVHVKQPYNINSTYFVIVLSLAYFIISFFSSQKNGAINQKLNGLCWVLLFLSLVVQPLEVFSYLKNNIPLGYDISKYDNLSHDFQYTRGRKVLLDSLKQEQLEIGGPQIYYASKGYQQLLSHIPYPVLKNYIYYRFIVYDQVKVVEKDFHYDDLTVSLRGNKNVAFIQPLPENYFSYYSDRGVTRVRNIQDIQGQPEYVSESSSSFKVVSYDSNQVTVHMHYDIDKYLVYNDSFHPLWNAAIDNNPVGIDIANIAFKGLFVPAGEHEITFRFNTMFQYYLKVLFMLIFYAVFLAVLFYGWRAFMNRNRAVTAQ
ncbi:MAG: hypothetical protein K8S27_12055 [Candidatus Omnitrophica bacterium]|nr:hypothetical protein [Candidatus Omnitrophota bacterium]